MFTIQCKKCDNELWCNEQELAQLWQCEVCGQWYDLFGTPREKPAEDYDFLKDPRFMPRDML